MKHLGTEWKDRRDGPGAVAKGRWDRQGMEGQGKGGARWVR